VDPTAAERRLAAILSADVVGYTRLMADDEAATIRTLTEYREEIGVLVEQHRGRLVDFTGDNFLAEFPTALDAMQGAVEIQRVIRERNADLSDDRRMEFRTGVHLGDVSVEAGRLYGDGVNIAARLQGLAEPGGIRISGEVHGQVRHKLDLEYEDLGEQQVKNLPDPVHVFRVKLEAEARAPEKARAVVAEILRVTPDLTVERAMDLILGLDQILSPEELARYPDYLRKAGLPE
jgi:class 3 adenylate cyclase